ncbi:hypothetical protein COT70_01145 [candidate division WWE3 bacterium CG09_land_8_20_14_0_10_47_33]|uniref:Type II secretion system protein GspF domain-containing protein n=1 Tax=candidate division WWE3 bacterium CG_4_9_14_0_2_um_filter_48_10 TaxID=1975078 RepID=A0A2M8EIR0_UNCKA|nr:MAG: hypothetical protein COT70_01145 [candidate division WWE3 bacterium CG09_land_8_20_14_0_10_47_33]PJC22600.1 MAG: hypothetical protein CO059_02170 [candidate division WWE3 bacterium CG_4_9_14_0_2_um_filter_48_10]PJE52362.1 MAG: hypothetical protein COV28_00010 [candidate division WWE3 bacterium CG10_big_fil_rev_8_21_14_0_10_48_23]
MPIYTYFAKSREGETLTGTIEAPDLDSAREILREKRYIVVSLTEKKEAKFAPLLSRFRGVSLEQKAFFARQLSTMIAAGLPFTNAFEVLRSQAENPRMKEVLTGMLGDIQGGATLSKSMRKYPDVFSRVFIALTEAGEASGKVEQVLAELAEKLEREQEFRGKTKGAFIYPAIIVAAMGIVFIIMIVFVIPRLSSMYADIGAKLPLPTLILIKFSNLLIHGWWFLLLLLGLGIFGLRQFIGGDYGRYKIAEFTFKFPIFGKLSKASQLADFCRTLSLLIGTGVPIAQALEITAEAMTNVLYRNTILNAEKQVEKGIPLSSPLKADPNFPPILSQMVAVGEETGKLDEVLAKLASFFEREAEQSVKNISTAIEPIIMILLGVLVGLFVISIITPIYNITSQL